MVVLVVLGGFVDLDFGILYLGFGVFCGFVGF